MDYVWVFDDSEVDWDELSHLYRIAPLGDKPPESLKVVFPNSMFKCFGYSNGSLVAVGRAIADGRDCAYIADVAVHPDHQGAGLGSAVIEHLLRLAEGHAKVILYANPGAEPFYERLGFSPMLTAMGIWKDRASAIERGLLKPSY